LKNITFALQTYESKYGVFPPAVVTDKHGKPMHSWRVLILPYLDRNDLYQRYRFNEPWNGPNNSQLLSENLSIFYCPSDPRGTNDYHTSYVAVVGDHTVWPGAKSIGTQAVSDRDGTARTLLLIETHNSGIHWMEPRDVSFDGCIMGIDGPRARSLPGGQCNHPGGSVVTFVDGHGTFLEDTVSATTMKELLTIDDDAPVVVDDQYP
jgi:prepilin-type processing-associated H-X9-DG protein